MSGVKVFTASWGQLEGKNSNMGDLIIFEAIIKMLRSMPHIKEIFCYSSDVDYTNCRYGVSSQNPFSVKGLLSTINNIKRSDVILLGGGELVQTKSSFIYLVANLAPGLLSILFKRRCLAIGAGIADQREISWAGRVLARFVLNRIEKVCVRDRTSLRNALAMGLKKDVLLLAADLAFHLSETDGSGARREGNKVLFCPRFTKSRKGGILPASTMKRFNKGEYWRKFNESAGRFAELLKAMAGEFDVILLPCYSGRGSEGKDRAFCRKVLELAGRPSNVQIYNGLVDFHEIRGLIKQTFVTVGVPVHTLILTSIMNNPSIALSYASKCSSFMREVGLDRYIMDITDSISESSVQRIIELIKECKLKHEEISATIKKKVRDLVRISTVNYDAILKCLRTDDIVCL